MYRMGRDGFDMDRNSLVEDNRATLMGQEGNEHGTINGKNYVMEKVEVKHAMRKRYRRVPTLVSQLSEGSMIQLMNMKVKKKMMHKWMRLMRVMLGMSMEMKIEGKIVSLMIQAHRIWWYWKNHQFLSCITYNIAIIGDFLAILFIEQNN